MVLFWVDPALWGTCCGLEFSPEVSIRIAKRDHLHFALQLREASFQNLVRGDSDSSSSNSETLSVFSSVTFSPAGLVCPSHAPEVTREAIGILHPVSVLIAPSIFPSVIHLRIVPRDLLDSLTASARSPLALIDQVEAVSALLKYYLNFRIVGFLFRRPENFFTHISGFLLIFFSCNPGSFKDCIAVTINRRQIIIVMSWENKAHPVLPLFGTRLPKIAIKERAAAPCMK